MKSSTGFGSDPTPRSPASAGWGGTTSAPTESPRQKITHCGFGVRAEDVVNKAKVFLEANNLGNSLRKALFTNPSKTAREYMSGLPRIEVLALEQAANSEK